MTSFDLISLRAKTDLSIVALGFHAGVIQSMLDFDFYLGRSQPSLKAIIGTGKSQYRLFYGRSQILIPGFATISEFDQPFNLFIALESGRRVYSSIEKVIASPGVLGGMIFAEGVSERNALAIRELALENSKFIIGPSSVGLLIGGQLKLGAIGGVSPDQIASAGIVKQGNVAVISSSGGMVNEIINHVSNSGLLVSFAVAIGGERFPILQPAEALTQAINDDRTSAIIYFGELGGDDEYQLADVYQQSNTDKPFICYIAGIIAESFAEPPQFGHAKALAQSKDQTTSAKKAYLRQQGASVFDSYLEFESAIADLTLDKSKNTSNELMDLSHRTVPLFADRISSDAGENVRIMGQDLLTFVNDNSLSSIALSMYLGHVPISTELPLFFDYCLRLLVDHGPQVSGVVTTMITARAGRDLGSALAAGLLSIGPRFGGALSLAACEWLRGVQNDMSPHDFVEQFAKSKTPIPGIGHKKYHLSDPDPRVAELIDRFSKGGPYLEFALSVQAITSSKGGNLILNVDGAIAAILLDILTISEKYNQSRIQQLLDTDFCNAIFITARTIGMTAHYIEQRRLDEPLFRLPDDMITSLGV